jgi:hypothetical protein
MPGPKGLSNDQLLARLLDLVHRGRKLEADLIAHLAEVDARRLYLREGCASMFAYCVGVLRFAEAVAYKRIAAARAARRYPELLTALRKGDLHLTAVSLLAPQLTAENVNELLAAARHRTADEIVLAHLFIVAHLLAAPPRLVVSRLLVLAHLLAPRVGSTRAPQEPKFRKPRSSKRAISQRRLPLSQRVLRVQPHPRVDPAESVLGHRSRSAMSAI